MSEAAIATIVTGFVTITTLICGVITLWMKLKENTRKLDQNTELTREGTAQASENAQIAATAANAAKETAKDVAYDLTKLLNGDLDTRIHIIVKEHTVPLIRAFEEHNKQDDRNMKEIRQALIDLTKHLE